MKHVIRNDSMELAVGETAAPVVLTRLPKGGQWVLDPLTARADGSGEDRVPFAGRDRYRELLGENKSNPDLPEASVLGSGSVEAEGDRSLIVTMQGRAGRLALRYELCAEGLRITLLSGRSTVTACSLPGAFHPGSRDVTPVVIPKNQGVWHQGTGKPFSFSMVRNGHAGWSMPFFASVGEKEALLTIVEDEHDCRLWFEKRPDGAVRIAAIMDPSMGKLAYDRSVLLRFVSPDLTAVCAAYRKYLTDRSRIVFWEEKIARRPNVERLFGGLQCFIGYCQDEDLDYAASFRSLKKAGFDRAFVYPLCIGNYRENFKMGGRPPIDIRRHLPLLEELGYLSAGWMWTEDIPELPGDLMHDKNGGPVFGWQIEDLKWYRACPAKQVAIANRIQDERMQGFTAHHFDVTASRAGLECRHPDHPLDKRGDAEWRKKILETAVRRGLVVSSEGFWGHASGSYDIGSVKIPVPVHDDWYTVPITSLVYHDSMIHDWWEPDNYNNPHHRNQFDRDKAYFAVPGGGWQALQAAYDALAGCPPNVMPFGSQYHFEGGTRMDRTVLYRYNLESREVREALALALPVTRLHRRIGKLACVGHETLLPDGSLQATVFGDGTRVVANFSEKPQEAPGVGVLGPVSWKAAS